MHAAERRVRGSEIALARPDIGSERLVGGGADAGNRPSGPAKRAYLLLTITALFWAGNAVAGRLAVGEISPMLLVCARWALVAGLLAVAARRQVLSAWPLLRPRWRSIAAMATLGFTAFNALFYVAAYYTQAVNIAIIQGSIPVLVLLGALIAHGTRITGLQMAGMVVTLAGVAVVAVEGDLASLAALQVNLGDLLMLIACLFYAGYTLALRDRPAVPGLAFFAVLAGVAFLTSLPLLAYEIAAGQVVWPSPVGWAILIYVALLPSFLSQVFFIRGVELIGPGRAGLFVNLVPVFGPLLAVGLLGEPFRLFHAVALALVLGGIFLAEQSRGRP